LNTSLNRQFTVDVLGYGADTSVNVALATAINTIKSNPQFIKSNSLSPQNIDIGEGLQKAMPNVGVPSLDLANGLKDLSVDTIIDDVWDDGGHTIVHRTWWGHYAFLDKRGTINMIRSLEQLGNAEQVLAVGGGAYAIIKKIVRIPPVSYILEGYLIINKLWFLPEAISQSNKCLNTTEISYLRVYRTGVIDVSCN
jgi:hypothetical protein